MSICCEKSYILDFSTPHSVETSLFLALIGRQPPTLLDISSNDAREKRTKTIPL